jgi:hypothetical protein
MKDKIAAFGLGLPLVLFLAATAAAYRGQVIVSVEAGACRLIVESDEASRALRLRVLPESRSCHIDKTSMRSALEAAFVQTDPPIPEGTYSSLYLGRLIDYPWLSQALATLAYRDPAWNRKKGRPRGLDINRYVADLLSRKEITAEMDAALAVGGYRVDSVTVEKVLVGGFADVPLYTGDAGAGKVPFDAMVWFRLMKK